MTAKAFVHGGARGGYVKAARCALVVATFLLPLYSLAGDSFAGPAEDQSVLRWAIGVMGTAIIALAGALAYMFRLARQDGAQTVAMTRDVTAALTRVADVIGKCEGRIERDRHHAGEGR